MKKLFIGIIALAIVGGVVAYCSRDFMKWLAKRNEKPEVNWPSILPPGR
jgi:hypothetical protein